MKIFRFVILFFSAAIFLTACNNNSDNSSDNKNTKILAYTSFYAVFDIVKKIGGDKVDVYNMTPNGTEPHNWEPTSRDMLNLHKADFLFYNGGGMERWIDKIKNSIENDNIKYICISDNIEFTEDDPHIWLNPKNALKQAENIKNVLSSADPDNHEYYNNNFSNFKAKIDKLDSSYRNTITNTKNKTIVVAHQAYGYLCDAYGIEQIAVEGLSADSEPSPAKMSEISNFIKENNIKYIFFEELLPTKAASVIAEETGAELLVLNPFESLSENNAKAGADYFSVMYENLENIKIALS